MGRFEIVVVGGSAGSIETLRELLPAIPPDVPFPIVVVVHLPPHVRSTLPDVLGRVTSLPTHHPEDGEELRPGHVYVAPPDRHVLIEDGRARLTEGPRENGARPSVDVLFRSAARTHGAGTVGVVLSGALGDGAAGLRAVKALGGLAIVQDPDEAAFTGMPTAALERVDVDEVLRAGEIGSLLATIGRGEVVTMRPGEGEPGRERDQGVARVEGTPPQAAPASGRGEAIERPAPGAKPAAYVCPDCGGTLFAEENPGGLRYVCRVGHGYSPEGLDEAKTQRVEDALWVALRTLEETADLSGRMAARAEERGLDAAAQRFRVRVDDAKRNAATIRSLLRGGEQERAG